MAGLAGGPGGAGRAGPAAAARAFLQVSGRFFDSALHRRRRPDSTAALKSALRRRPVGPAAPMPGGLAERSGRHAAHGRSHRAGDAPYRPASASDREVVATSPSGPKWMLKNASWLTPFSRQRQLQTVSCLSG